MLFLAAALAFFVYGMVAAMLGTILPELSRKFGLTPNQNGQIALAQALGLMLGSLTAGPLIDAEGYKAGLVTGLGLVLFVLRWLPRSKGYGHIVLLLFLLGLAGGTIVTGANSLAYDIGGERQAATLNLLNLFFGLGGLATPFLLANLLKGNSARLCSVAAALAGGTLVLHAAVRMPAPKSVGVIKASELGALLGRPELWLLSMMLFLYIGCEVGVWNWLSRHLIAQGIPEARALNILSLGFALGLLLGRAGAALVFEALAPETVTLAASIAMAITTFAALRTRSSGIAWVAAFLAGASMAPVFPTTLAITGRDFPAAQATAMGIVVMSGWIGVAVSSRIIGAIAGNDPARLKAALLVLPCFSVLMVGVNLALGAV